METNIVATELLGKSFDEAQQKLGEPFKQDQFALGTEVLEYRVELTNFFDETRRAENPPQIREAAWSLSAEENLTLWFSQPEGTEEWQVLHFLSWHPDDQF